MQQPTRRSFLQSTACGFGGLALADLLAAQSPLAPRTPMIPARAKRVIFLYMRGGPSHMDTFDYKPRLQQDDGKDLPFALPRLQVLQRRNLQKLMGSPFKFRRHGQSGLWCSEVFPLTAQHMDKLCVVKSMHTEGVDHGQATIKLHTGAESFVRPSLGSWVVYGLGSENQNLPGFITICPLRSDAGTRSYGSAFLPAAYGGTPIGFEEIPSSQATIRDLSNPRLPADVQRLQLDLLQSMNRAHLQRATADRQLEGSIHSFELGFRMQGAAPALMDLTRETSATLRLYGIGTQPTDEFGRQCLMARRFAEAGVRFIQLTYTSRKLRGISDWDQHTNLKGDLEFNALATDRPVAALLTDLHARGLLEDTVVWWGGEFGRTPVSEGRGGGVSGRDHNPYGFTHWLAGGGVKPGISHGDTDDFGYHAVSSKVHMHDMHATLLHLLGIDHERLTYRYAGRDFRLTDVYGNVVHEILR